MVDELSQSKAFRRLEDGRYLYRDHFFARTVILEADLAQKVFEGRKIKTWIVWPTAGLASTIGVLYRSDRYDLIGIVLLLLLVPAWLLYRSHRKQTYWDSLRRAPTAPDSMALGFDWANIAAERMAPWVPKLGIVAGPFMTALMAVILWTELMQEESDWAGLLLTIALTLLMAGFSLFYLKIWQAQRRKRSSQQESSN